MEKPSYMSPQEWELLISIGLAEQVAKSSYRPPVIPPELRVSIDGWDTILNEWEKQALFLYKKDFFRRGLKYVSLGGYLDHRVDEQIKLHRYEEFVYDRLSFPAETEHERIEGERRLAEYITRLKRLVEISDCKMETDDIALMRDSLRNPPATETQIQTAESRLGLHFPPSYREFLKISNGWLIEQQPPLMPVEKVAYLRELDPEYVRLWLEEEYMYQGGEILMTQEPLGEGETFACNLVDISTACLKNAVVIGVDWTEKAFLLLDPTTVNEYGEWRAFWLFRYEGPIVTNSFARLMEFMYRRNTER